MISKVKLLYIFLQIFFVTISIYSSCLLSVNIRDIDPNDTEMLLKYLNENRIPQNNILNKSSNLQDIEHIINTHDELQYTTSLFIKGDHTLRIAIVKSLDMMFLDSGIMWDACTTNDYEVKHYLLWGIADSALIGKTINEHIKKKYWMYDSISHKSLINDYDPEVHKKALKWMLNSADRSYSEPILRAMCLSEILINNNFSDKIQLTKRENLEVLGLIKCLYRQNNIITMYHKLESKGYSGDSGPANKYAIRALRKLNTRNAFDTLIQWIKNDGKKVNLDIRKEMLSTFGHFMHPSQHVKYQDKLLLLAKDLDFVEFILLSYEINGIKVDEREVDNSSFGMRCALGNSIGDDSVVKMFNKSVLQLLKSYDEKVIKGAIVYISKNQDDVALIENLKNILFTTVQKENIRRGIQNIYLVNQEKLSLMSAEEIAKNEQEKKIVMKIIIKE